MVPSLALQPLLENAIRHGIGKHREPDVITICARRSDGRLYFEICNLAGALEDAPKDSLRRGLGLSNTQARPRSYTDRNSHLRSVAWSRAG